MPTMDVFDGFNPRLRAGGDLHGSCSYLQPLPFQPAPPRGRRLAERTRTRARFLSFNPRLRAGGDSRPPWWTSSLSGFNPRLRAGGDMLAAGAAPLRPVSTHASAREATYTPVPGMSITVFQPTPPRGRRHREVIRLVPEFTFQPTPPRGRRHVNAAGDPRAAVSTHASAREATSMVVVPTLTCEVSTHASAREATRDDLREIDGLTVSTHASAREATSRARCAWLLPATVSTHASAREATLRHVVHDTAQMFQPTPPRGRRLGVVLAHEGGYVFQPTPPRGRRQRSAYLSTLTESFQPTPPRGRRRLACLTFLI